MRAPQGCADSNSAKPPASQKSPEDPLEADRELSPEGAEDPDEFAANSLADDEPDTLGYDDDADGETPFDAEADPDVAAVDSVMAASRKQRLADKNSNIRRLLEERSEARQLQQDLDYLDFDD